MLCNQLVLVRGACTSSSSEREAHAEDGVCCSSFCWAFTGAAGNSASFLQAGPHDAGIVLELLAVALLSLQRKREQD